MRECKYYQEMMQRDLDGELSELEKRGLIKHIAICPTCAADYRSFQQLEQLFIETEWEELPFDFSQKVMDLVLTQESPTIEDLISKERSGLSENLKISPLLKEELAFNIERSTSRKWTGLNHFITLLVLLAIFNGMLFLQRFLPLLKLELRSFEIDAFNQFFIQFFTKSLVIGHQTGGALGLAIDSVVQNYLFQWGFWLIALILSVSLGIYSWFRITKNGGNFQ